MKSAKKSFKYSLVCAAAGIIVLLSAIVCDLGDDFKVGLVSGLGGSLTFIGIFGLVNGFRLKNDPKRAKELEIAESEERTQFIRMKACSSIYLVSILLESFGALVSGLLGYREVSVTLAVLITVQAILYVVYINYYNRKY